MKSSILVVDDDPGVREALRIMLQDDYHPIAVASSLEALEKLQKLPVVDLALLDINMPEQDGIETLRKMKEIDPLVEVIMVTANKTAEAAIKTIKYGAYDYVTKPFDIAELTAIINRALEKRNLTRMNQALTTELEGLIESDMVGKSPAMQAIYSLIEKVADSDSTVLIHGESGTGKELVARALHKKGDRSNRPFVGVNCAAIPAELVESEFFGHERGAFTSAVARKIGKFEFANGGVIFLDDVSGLSLPIQAKLLRVLQEKEIVRVGSNEVIPVDVRVIAATNDDLKALIKLNRFREDLYYRLKVVPIDLPPLRARREDIPLLIEHFVRRNCEHQHKPFKKVDPATMELLCNYNWPGNVRELENLIEMMVLLASGNTLSAGDLPANILTNQYLPEASPEASEGIPLKKARQQFERQFIVRVLEKVRWNQTKAAKAMGIHRNTLILKMEELEIREARPKP
ncbi:MAG: sigma-54-dependent Fis family transcriptional regulator [Candidatus Firestonebacteria bacterium]|nr:sigma-54-dependent Fis family transcriptional regulator [Candidatus Firestonebacteria bacterium]